MQPERRDRVWQDQAVAMDFARSERAAVPFAQDQLSIMLRLLAAAEADLGRPLASVLDVGCGDGVLAHAILDRFPQCRAALVDFSAPMLDEAHRRLEPLADRCLFRNADLASPAWTSGLSGPFDAIVSGYCIHHQNDATKRRIYAEIHSLLRPGGIFVHTEHVASATPWVEQQWDAMMIDALHGHARARDDEGGPERSAIAARYHGRADKEANQLTPVERQCDWLRELGFTDVDCYFKVFELAVFGGRRRLTETHP